MKKNKLFTIALFLATLMANFSLSTFASGTPNGQVFDMFTTHPEEFSGTSVFPPSDMIRKWAFDYVALDRIINKLEQEPNYTAGELTMFRDNCRKYLLRTATNPRRFVIVINEDTGEVIINGRRDLHNKFKFLPTGYEMSNESRLYRHLFLAMEEARSRGIYEQVFKEVKVK